MRCTSVLRVVIVLLGLTFSWSQAEESPWCMFRHDLHHTGRSPFTEPADSTLHWAFSANAGIASSPAIGTDGTVYVGVGWSLFDSCLYAVNPDGNLKWCFKSGYGIFSSPAIGPEVQFTSALLTNISMQSKTL